MKGLFVLIVRWIKLTLKLWKEIRGGSKNFRGENFQIFVDIL